jgi:4-amino-4-deoxy-L-arabinose transferase-like glycosyltransferase
MPGLNILRAPILSKRSVFIPLAAIACLGVLLQYIVLFVVIKDPYSLYWPDPNIYLRIAEDLFAGRPFDMQEVNLTRAPGYPYFLSILMHIVGTDIFTLRIVHIALFPIFIVGLYLLGKRVADERTGILAALLGAIYPFFVYVPLTFYPQALLIYLSPFIALTVLMGREGKLIYGLAAGILIGIGIFTRPTLIYWLPSALFYWFYPFPWVTLKKQIIKAVVLLCLPAVLFAAGWVLRNHAVYGRYFFSTIAGETLLITYNENAVNYIFGKQNFVLPPAIAEELEQAKTLQEKELIQKKHAYRFIREHPWQSLYLALYQSINIWNPIPLTYQHGREASLILKVISGIPYMVYLFLAIIGWVIYSDKAVKWMLLLLLIFNTLLNGMFMVSVRYRLDIDFVLVLFAAYALQQWSLEKRWLVGFFPKK